MEKTDNTWQDLSFAVDGLVMQRTLADCEAEKLDFANEISVRSPVGHALRFARPGDEVQAQAPGGMMVKVKLLEVH